MQYKIPSEQLLPFIKNEDLYKQVAAVLEVAIKAKKESEDNFYKNSIDPFSALFDAMVQGVSLDSWTQQEKSRQIQKTFQNSMGTFHQEILGSFDGWKSLGVGQIVDIVNDEKKIIAEVKNKHNTTKGNHKIAIYDDIKMLQGSKYAGYTGYYVEVIPKNKKVYDKEFTPSDNKLKERRGADKMIRVVDGKTFYDMASGQNETLKRFYSVLPKVASDILGEDFKKINADEDFAELFNKTY